MDTGEIEGHGELFGDDYDCGCDPGRDLKEVNVTTQLSDEKAAALKAQAEAQG
jgi:hypothetical protein